MLCGPAAERPRRGSVNVQPGFGQASLGAIVGAVVGAIGGLFAVGLAAAILSGDAALLLATPKVSALSWLVCGGVGWLLGGQLGPRLGERFQHRNAEIAGGLLGGLIPVALVALWGWHVVTHH